MKMLPEWAAQTRVWVSPPHNPETWPGPGCLERAQQQFTAFTEALSRTTNVQSVAELGIATDDAWIRDYGPIFVSDGKNLAVHDFRFNNWGEKYGDCANDDAVTKKIAAHLNIPITSHDFVLEGGSIDINSTGVLLTTKQCLLHPKRNAHLTQRDIENKLIETLGLERIVWLPGGIEGDDTDGHVDDIARFITNDVIAAVSAPKSHPDHAITQQNLAALHEFEVVEMPAPQPIWFDDPTEGRRMLPCSYVNFLMSNGQVLVPVFGQHTDDLALRLLDNALPGYHIEPVRAEVLVIGYGSLHCMTMQEPAC